MKKPKPVVASGAERGKYANLLKQGSNVSVLDPELMTYFPDSASVNRALHAFLVIDEQVQSVVTRMRRGRPRAESPVEL